MNVFNKVVVVILLLFLVVASIVSLVNLFANLYQLSDIADRVINYFDRANQFVVAIVLFLVLLVSLLLLVLEFYRKKVKAASISKDKTGKTMITLKTVSGQIREKLASMDNVIDPKVNILPKNDGIIINILSGLVKGDNVSRITQDIRNTAYDFASGQMGFKVLETNYVATGFVEGKQKPRPEPQPAPKPEPEQVQEPEPEAMDTEDAAEGNTQEDKNLEQ